MIFDMTCKNKDSLQFVPCHKSMLYLRLALGEKITRNMVDRHRSDLQDAAHEQAS